jgi:hypothetical protein
MCHLSGVPVLRDNQSYDALLNSVARFRPVQTWRTNAKPAAEVLGNISNRKISGLICAHHWGAIYQGGLKDAELYGRFRASLSPSIQAEKFSVGVG